MYRFKNAIYVSVLNFTRMPCKTADRKTYDTLKSWRGHKGQTAGTPGRKIEQEVLLYVQKYNRF